MTVSKKLIENVTELKKSLNEISVYDLDVYTSMELYYKVAKKLNEVITELMRFEGVVSDEVVEQNEKLVYLLGEGLNTEVVNFIKQLIANGTIERILNFELFNDLNNQIKNLSVKKITLNDCDKDLLLAIQNKDSETSFDLLSEPREKSVDISKFKDYDLITIDRKWSELNRKSDGTGNWGNNLLYKKGYVKNIKVDINSETDIHGKVFIYKKFKDGQIQVQSSYNVNGKGVVTIPVNKYIEHDFYVSTRCENVRYESSETIKAAIFGTTTEKFSPNFELNYCFAVGIEYYNLYTNQDNLLFNQNKNLLNPCSLLPTASGFEYPIVFDFTTNTLNISNIYVLDTSLSLISKPSYKIQNKSLVIKDIPEEGYYVIYLMFDCETKELELYYSNGETLPLDLSNFGNKLTICYGLTDGKTYFTFGEINERYVKVIVKNSLNVDDTLEDDKIIPKFAEKKIITSLQQQNRWFNKKVNIIGDSVIKGENSEDRYKRMKDDNIACILMEEYGFKVARNYGIGGSRISSHVTNENGMVDRFNRMDNDADLIIIAGGTNDFGNDVELGNLSNLSDNTKFKPALYNTLKGLQDKYHGKEIYFVTPTHRKDSKPDNIANRVGLTLKDYVEAAYEVCELLSIPIIDMWKELGFSPFNSTLKSIYMTDGLHPTVKGMRQYYGKKICKAIK